MKKKKIGVIASAIATSAVCASMVVGSTFALFTDEESVNLAITAANVEVNVSVTAGTVQSELNETYGELIKTETGYALTNATPGETYPLTIKTENKSTIPVLYQVSFEFTNVALASAFTVTVEDAVNGDGTGTEGCIKSYTSAWAPLAKGADAQLGVTVAFPYSADKQNGYKGLSTDINVKVEAVQGNAQGYTVGGDPVVEEIKTTVVHNTAEAQAALDSAEENEVIYLASGNYDKLWIRSSEKSVSLTEYANNYDESSKHLYPVYERTLNNVAIIGDEDAMVKGLQVREYQVKAYNGYNSTYVDPKSDGWENPLTHDNKRHYEKIVMNDITLAGFTFVEEGFVVDLVKEYAAIKDVYSDFDDGNYINGLTLSGLTMDGKGMTNIGTANWSATVNGLIRVKGAQNVLVENCTVKNAQFGSYFEFTNDVTLKNNTYNGLAGNPASFGQCVSGDINFVGNTVSNVGNRVFRMSSNTLKYDATKLYGILFNASIKDTWHVTLADNVILENCGDPGDIKDGKGVFVKIGVSGDGTGDYEVAENFTVTNNYWYGLDASKNGAGRGYVFHNDGLFDTNPKLTLD